MTLSTAKIMLLVATLTCAGSFTTALAAAKPGAASRTPKAEEKPQSAAIPYDELRFHVGERVVVETRFKSTRTGTLAKASQYELVLSVPTLQGPAELTMPKDTILRVTPAETPKPAKP